MHKHREHSTRCMKGTSDVHCLQLPQGHVEGMANLFGRIWVLPYLVKAHVQCVDMCGHAGISVSKGEEEVTLDIDYRWCGDASIVLAVELIG